MVMSDVSYKGTIMYIQIYNSVLPGQVQGRALRESSNSGGWWCRCLSTFFCLGLK